MLCTGRNQGNYSWYFHSRAFLLAENGHPSWTRSPIMYPSRVRTCRWRLIEYTKRVYISLLKETEIKRIKIERERDEDSTSEVVISTRIQRWWAMRSFWRRSWKREVRMDCNVITLISCLFPIKETAIWIRLILITMLKKISIIYQRDLNASTNFLKDATDYWNKLSLRSPTLIEYGWPSNVHNGRASSKILGDSSDRIGKQ